MELKEWEKELTKLMLVEYINRLSNDGCNDTDEEWLKEIPEEEHKNIEKKFHKWNRSMEYYDKGHITVIHNNSLLSDYILGRIEGEIE